jgi:malonyl-CoA O-methyltransferase
MHELDQIQLRRANDRIATRFDADDFICSESGQRLLERLSLITLKPEVILDLGAGTGRLTAELQRLYPDARIIALDWSPVMLKVAANRATLRLCADSHQLPLLDNSVDMIVSNLMLPGAANPLEIFAEAQRVLRTPGLFLRIS